VLEVIKAAEAVLGKDVPHSLGPRRAGDPIALVADVSKIKKEMGWEATQSDLETLIRTASNWERNRRY
jgi:UDP-glucose 4-epimerase